MIGPIEHWEACISSGMILENVPQTRYEISCKHFSILYLVYRSKYQKREDMIWWGPFKARTCIILDIRKTFTNLFKCNWRCIRIHYYTLRFEILTIQNKCFIVSISLILATFRKFFLIPVFKHEELFTQILLDVVKRNRSEQTYNNIFILDLILAEFDFQLRKSSSFAHCNHP